MIFTYLVPSITFVFNVVLTDSFLTRKRPMAAYLLVWSLALFFTTMGYIVLSRSGVKDYFYFYLCNTAAFIACFFLYKESFSQKIFIFFAIWGLSSFVSSMCNWIATWLQPGSDSSAIRTLMFLGCYAAIIPINRKFWRQGIREMLALFESGKPIYAALPFVAFVLFAAIFGPSTKPTNLRWFGIMLLFECLILFMYYLLFAHFRAVYHRLRAEENLRSAERQRLLQKKYYEEVDKGVRMQDQLLHDARHHLLAVASLAQTGDAAALEQYVEQLLENYGRSRTRRYCAHSVANAIIGGYIDIAEKKGISVSVEIDLPQDIGIDEYDICALFGNTIENAIEACQRIPAASGLYDRRYIDIRSRAEPGRFAVRIENSFQDKLDVQMNHFMSSKGALGGVGLESVQMVVDMYEGSMNVDKRDNIFILSAVLCPRPLTDVYATRSA